MKELPPVGQRSPHYIFEQYETKFKALADQRRLRIMYELCQRGKSCVCDLVEIMGMPQSSLSYHLKMLVDTNLITRETHGTWSYYEINDQEISKILSDQLCCIFRLGTSIKKGDWC